MELFTPGGGVHKVCLRLHSISIIKECTPLVAAPGSITVPQPLSAYCDCYTSMPQNPMRTLLTLSPLPPPHTHPCLSPQHVCSYACSEEVPEPVALGGEGFSVAFDPLDGSSIVDTNFAVGTIFGVWPGDKLQGITGRQQVRSLTVYCCYYDVDTLCYRNCWADSTGR